jgi:hypothetical protein
VVGPPAPCRGVLQLETDGGCRVIVPASAEGFADLVRALAGSITFERVAV